MGYNGGALVDKAKKAFKPLADPLGITDELARPFKKATGDTDTAPLSEFDTMLMTAYEEFLKAKPGQREAPVMAMPGGITKPAPVSAQGVTAANAPATGPAVTNIDRAGISNVSTAPIGVNLVDQAASRAQLLQLAGVLQQQASGAQDSGAVQKLRQEQETARGQQIALASAARGGNVGLAQRQAAVGLAELGQKGAADIAAQKAIDIKESQNTLAGVLTNLRAGDLSASDLEFKAAVASAENKLRADLANQGVDFEVLKANAMSGNAAALAEYDALVQTELANLDARISDADRILKADLANQGVDLDVAKFDALRGDQIQQFNIESKLKQQGLDDAAIAAWWSTQLSFLGQKGDIAKAYVASDEAARQRQIGLISGLSQAGATAVKGS